MNGRTIVKNELLRLLSLFLFNQARKVKREESLCCKFIFLKIMEFVVKNYSQKKFKIVTSCMLRTKFKDF